MKKTEQTSTSYYRGTKNNFKATLHIAQEVVIPFSWFLPSRLRLPVSP